MIAGAAFLELQLACCCLPLGRLVRHRYQGPTEPSTALWSAQLAACTGHRPSERVGLAVLAEATSLLKASRSADSRFGLQHTRVRKSCWKALYASSNSTAAAAPLPARISRCSLSQYDEAENGCQGPHTGTCGTGYCCSQIEHVHEVMQSWTLLL